MTKNDDLEAIRIFLRSLDPRASSEANSPLPLGDLYAPSAHANALDPNRPLVVGNRGVGKSVWSGVLADEVSRLSVADDYPKLRLNSMKVELGFHQAAGKDEGVAPSPRLLERLLRSGIDTYDIWNAVLFRAVSPFIGHNPHNKIIDTINWMSEEVEDAEEILRSADKYFTANGFTFVLVFDALDQLGKTWSEIQPLTEGILRLALDMLGFRAMRAKVFMRTDQVKDPALFQFPDASKMRAGKVDLEWHATELYGLLYTLINNSDEASGAFSRIVKEVVGRRASPEYLDDKDDQIAVFNAIAGEFMGSDRRRGRTYTWIIDHLADAFGETTPRSFLIALQRAAQSRNRPVSTAIDYVGIREGVQQASTVRVAQLQEDYPWILQTLEDLAGLEVPCHQSQFIDRWRERKTVKVIKEITEKSKRPGPIELEHSFFSEEDALIESLKTIGVVEERSADKINMPDIFRVAAKIKRRGGVRPPVSGAKRG
ncbi:hypothetical protein [Azospirillum sp. TSH64]|uniref:hypothetical protein n=1 Tax=Azospirillum sp. TSH64 TaxID=652740 RepID=UPI0011B1ED04|nr:hypothetical protein [Azospirillum sp. TSH64]